MSVKLHELENERIEERAKVDKLHQLMNRENDEQKLHMKEQNDKLKNDNLHFLEDFRKEMQQIQTMERDRWREMQKDFER